MAYDPNLGYDPDQYGYGSAYGDWSNPAPGTSGAANGPTFEQVSADYQNFLGRPLTQAEYQTHWANATNYNASQIANSQEGLAYQSQKFADPAPKPAATPTPQTPVTGGGGGGQTAGPKITDPITQPFTAPPPVNLGGPAGIPYIPPTPQAPQTPSYTPPSFTPPTYTKPPAFEYQAFKGPGVEEALNDPSYQFRTQQGNDALQRWAAAKGTLNDSGTAHALVDYGQQAASQEYQNIWNRDYNAWSGNRQNALDTYSTNYGSQYADPYRNAYQSATDAFAPQMAGFNANVGATNTAYNTQNNNAVLGYSTQAAAGQHTNDTNYLNAWNAWLQSWNMAKDQRDSTWDKTVQGAQLYGK